LLLELDGDQGARALLSANPEQVVEVAVEDPGILLDIDTPQQLDSARELFEKNKAHPGYLLRYLLQMNAIGESQAVLRRERLSIVRSGAGHSGLRQRA